MGSAAAHTAQMMGHNEKSRDLQQPTTMWFDNNRDHSVSGINLRTFSRVQAASHKKFIMLEL